MAQSLLTKSYQTPLMLALEIVTREFESLPVEEIKNFWNPAKCRADLLPSLAIMLGVINTYPILSKLYTSIYSSSTTTKRI